jgi:PPM family protein phosphatase
MTALRCTAFTDVGPNRKNNQDSAYASPRLLVLADGMGGQAAGDLASAVAVQTVRRLDRPPEGDLLEALAGATHRASDRLSELVDEDAELEGMGTTLIAMVFEAADGGPDRLQIAHVGDSRAYLLRGGQIEQLTKDHTFVQSLVDEGRISAAEARTHPHRSLILKALQGGHTVDPDLFSLDVAVGDRILLCSDGLSDYVDVEVIGAALGDGSIEMAATNLVRMALEARTTDNVTCVVAEVVPDEDADPAAQPLLVGSVASAPRPPTGAGTTGSLPAVEHDGDDDYADDDVDLEELRYAPRSRRRNSWLLRLVVVAAALLVVGLAVTWLYDWTQSKYFVAESDGLVAIYKGVPVDIPGVSLSSVHEVTDLAVADLPDYSRERLVDGIGSDDLESAQATVAELQALAEDCASNADTTAACDDSGTAGGAG